MGRKERRERVRPTRRDQERRGRGKETSDAPERSGWRGPHRPKGERGVRAVGRATSEGRRGKGVRVRSRPRDRGRHLAPGVRCVRRRAPASPEGRRERRGTRRAGERTPVGRRRPEGRRWGAEVGERRAYDGGSCAERGAQVGRERRRTRRRRERQVRGTRAAKGRGHENETT